MSSLRNHVKKRQYRERSQPHARQKLGLLEKHKDYVLRAKDYNLKSKRIKALKTKASLRNPDEFYHRMERSRTVNGVHREDPVHVDQFTAEELLLMSSQDEKYVETRVGAERARLERLKANIVSATPGKWSAPEKKEDSASDGEDRNGKRRRLPTANRAQRASHIKFVEVPAGSDDDNDDEQHLVAVDATRAAKKRKRADAEQLTVLNGTRNQLQRVNKKRQRMLDSIAGAEARLAALEKVLAGIRTRKLLASKKGQRVCVVPKEESGTGVGVYRWKRRRAK